MQPRSLAFLTLTMLALHVPGAVAAPVPDTVARSLGDAVTITFTHDPAAEAGDVLPFCNDASDVPDNRTLVGSIVDDCFWPFSHSAMGGPLVVCDPVIVNTYPTGVAPDEQCIESIGEWILSIVLELLPVQPGIQLHQ